MIKYACIFFLWAICFLNGLSAQAIGALEALDEQTFAKMAREKISSAGVGISDFKMQNKVNADPQNFGIVAKSDIKFANEIFPKETLIAYYKCDADELPHLYFTAPKGISLSFRGAKCKYLSQINELSFHCDLSEEFQFKKFKIPSKTTVIFKRIPDRNDPVSVAYFDKLSQKLVLNGKPFRKGGTVKIENDKFSVDHLSSKWTDVCEEDKFDLAP